MLRNDKLKSFDDSKLFQVQVKDGTKRQLYRVAIEGSLVENPENIHPIVSCS